jgi:hypothetical protein
MMERKIPAVPADKAPERPRASSRDTLVAVGILGAAIVIAAVVAVTQRATRSAAPPPLAREQAQRAPLPPVAVTRAEPKPAPPPPVAATRREPEPAPPPPVAVMQTESKPASPPQPPPPVAAAKREPEPAPPPAPAAREPAPVAPVEVARSEPPPAPPAQAQDRTYSAASGRHGTAPEPTRETPPSDADIEIKFWNAVRESGDLALVQSYLDHYPQGRFAEQARQRLAELRAQRRDPPPEAPSVAARRTDERDVAVASPPPTPPPPEDRPTAAAAPPAAAAPAPPPPAQNVELVRALQREFKRIGCLSGEPDGVWGETTRSAFKNFVKHAKLSVDNDEPTAAVLDAATAARTRVCPLVCEEGEHVVRGRCVEKVRRVQARESEEKRPRPRAERHAEPPSRPRAERPSEPASSPRGGQKLCFGGARNELIPCN